MSEPVSVDSNFFITLTQVPCGITHNEVASVIIADDTVDDNYSTLNDDIDDYEYADDDESYDDDSDESSDEVLDEMEAFDRIFGGDDLFEKMLEVSERVRKSNLENNHDNDQGEAK